MLGNAGKRECGGGLELFVNTVPLNRFYVNTL